MVIFGVGAIALTVDTDTRVIVRNSAPAMHYLSSMLPLIHFFKNSDRLRNTNRKLWFRFEITVVKTGDDTAAWITREDSEDDGESGKGHRGERTTEKVQVTEGRLTKGITKDLSEVR